MKQGRSGRLSWWAVALVVLLCCLIAYLGARIVNSVRRNHQSIGSYRIVELPNVQKLKTVKDGFVYYDGSSIIRVDSSSTVKWSYAIGGNADFDVTDSGTAAWVNQRLMLIDDESGESDYSGNMDTEVLSARVGKEYAAVLLGPEHNSTIVLMETGGRRVDSITLAEQTVIDFGFFYNDTLFWVMTLDTNGTAPSCTVNTYRPGRRLVGSISDSEQVFYHANFESSQINCIGEIYLRAYNYNGSEEASKRRLIYGWTLADSDDSGDTPLMVFMQNGAAEQANGIREIRMIRGNADQIVHLPFGCSALFASGNSVYGFSGDGYLIIARIGQKKAEAYRLSAPFDRVYGILQNSTALLGSGELVYMVSLK